MKTGRLAFIVAFCFLSQLRLIAQSEERDFYLIISKVDSLPNNQARLHLDYGTNLGIYEGQECSVWGLHYSDYPDHNNQTLATGKVTSVTDSSCVAIVDILYSGYVYQVYDGDMMHVKLPGKDGYQGLFYEMIDRAVFFTDQNNDVIYYFGEIFFDDSEYFEEDILDYMSNDIRTLGKDLVGTMDDIPIEGGIYAGSTMLKAMQKTTSRDVKSFIRYVSTWPGKYMGKTWKITETYATWLINNTPMVSDDYMEMLEDLNTEADYDSLFQKYGFGLDADVISDMGTDAKTYANNGDSEKAHELADKIIKIAERTEDPDMMGWAYFKKARIHSVKDELEETIKWYKKGEPLFYQTDNKYALSLLLNNIGSAYNNLSQWEEAIEYYKKTDIIKIARLEEDSTQSRYEDIAFSLYGLGDSYFDNGIYDSALLAFDRQTKIYAATGNLAEELENLEYLANSYAKLGDLDKAAEIHRDRIARGDADMQADATFDLAYVYNGYGEDFEKAIPVYRESYELHMALGDTSMAALSLSNIAQSQWSLKKLDESISNHLETIALAEAFGEKSRIANSWDKLADLYSENGNPKKSLEAYDRVLELYKELEDPKYGETLNEVGDVYKDAKDYLKAISYYEQSFELAQSHEDYTMSSDAMYDIADTYYQDKKYDISKVYYDKAIEEASKTNYPTQEIYCLSNIGLIYSIKDQYAKSDSVFSIALQKAEDLQDNNIIAFCKYRLASSASRQRDYDRTEKLYYESLEMFRDLEDQTWEVNVLNSLSFIYVNRGEFEKALEILDEALKISTENNDRNNMAYAYSYKSDLYLRTLGEFDKALEMQQKSMDLFKEIDNSWGIADAYLGFGNIKNLTGEYEEAIEYYELSDSLYAELGNYYARATPYNNMGTIYYWQVDYDKALNYFTKAMDILDSIGVKDASRSLYVSNIGTIYLEQKRFEESDKWLKEALADAREINDVNQISTNLSYLGKLKTETKEYELSRQYLEEALDLIDRLGMETHRITVNFALGKLSYLEKSGDAMPYLDEAINVSLRMGTDKELWEAYYYKGLIAQDEGRLDDSKEHFIDAIETLEKIQSKVVGGAEAKKIFASGERQIMVYGSLVDVLIAKGEIELALQYLERSNVESLRNKFSQLQIQFKDNEANEKLKKEKELKLKLDNLDRTIADEKSGQGNEEKLKKLEASKTIAENEYLKFVNTTINTNPELSKHFSGGFHPRKLKTDKNRRLIPDELVVLSYLPANDKLYIFAATSDTVIAKVVNVTLDELNKNIKFIYNFASFQIDGHQTDELRIARGESEQPAPKDFNPKESQYKKVSEVLFNWTIAPVRDELDKKSKVVIIPTGMLHFLPFQMLGEKLPNGKFDFLIEHYTLFYAHSLDMLYQEAQPIDELSILAMANADRTLPSAQEEVLELQKMYPLTEVFLHEDASEDKAKSHGGKHNVLHFATHGNLDYFDYHKSYLTLAPNADGSEDGQLTIEEVWEIEDIYEYNMVTLSACKTAVTEDFSSGWPVSPATSFIDAGAPTVVASLWAVSDVSTGLLMEYFYRNIKTMPKVEALRRAQIELSQNEKFSHPYHWAPFILIGDWR